MAELPAPLPSPDGLPTPGEGPALVPGELRGYRQFRLQADGLYPVVHTQTGPWSAGVHSAVCAIELDHAPPDRECACGLYGWYHPSSVSGSFGQLNAVIAVRGRTVLGDRGFRAAAGRIEAVALPWRLRVRRRAGGQARAMLASRYPDVRVYDSTRRMMREYPCHDVRELGITPRPDRRRGYRWAAGLVWALFVLACYSLLFIPREALSNAGRHLWPLGLLAVVVWQTALIVLIVRASPSDRPPVPAVRPPLPPDREE